MKYESFCFIADDDIIEDVVVPRVDDAASATARISPRFPVIVQYVKATFDFFVAKNYAKVNGNL